MTNAVSCLTRKVGGYMIYNLRRKTEIIVPPFCCHFYHQHQRQMLRAGWLRDEIYCCHAKRKGLFKITGNKLLFSLINSKSQNEKINHKLGGSGRFNAHLLADKLRGNDTSSVGLITSSVGSGPQLFRRPLDRCPGSWRLFTE